MPVPLIGLWHRRRRRPRNDPFTRATTGDLDIVMPPPYDMSDTRQDEARTRVEELLSRLQPGGLDAGSRDVLNNLINAWADEEVMRLTAERDERQAVGDVLVGLAREEVARRKPAYDRDLARALHAREALDVAFAALSGKKTAQLSETWPRRLDDQPIGSTLGPIDRDDPSDLSSLDDLTDPPDATSSPARRLPGEPLPDATGNTQLHTTNGDGTHP